MENKNGLDSLSKLWKEPGNFWACRASKWVTSTALKAGCRNRVSIMADVMQLKCTGNFPRSRLEGRSDPNIRHQWENQGRYIWEDLKQFRTIEPRTVKGSNLAGSLVGGY